MVGFASSLGWNKSQYCSIDRASSTYVKQVLLSYTILVLLFEIHISSCINSQDLAILCNNTLTRTRRLCRSSCSGSLCSFDLVLPIWFVFLGGLILHTTLLSVEWLQVTILIFICSRRADRGGWSRRAFDTRNVQRISPSSLSCELDVSSYKLLLSLPAQPERTIVTSTTNEHKEANKNRAESRSETRVIVSSALPLWKPVGQEMIVTLTSWTTQDVGDYTQSRESIRCSLTSSRDFRLGWSLAHVHTWLLLASFWFVFACGSIGDELLLDLVGMEGSRPLAIGLVDVVLVGIGLDAYEIVEADADTFGSFDFITETKDLLVCGRGI